MQAHTDVDLENWHDFEIHSRREIVSLLRNIGEKKQLIRMLVRGEADVCITSILDVDATNGTLTLDCSINPEQNRRMLAATAISFETSLDKVRILFGGDSVRAAVFEGGAALQMALPEYVVRLQRREFYRMATPLVNPVRTLIPLPATLGGGTALFPLSDISCGGIAILDNKLLLGNTIGDNYLGCSIELPDIGSVHATLQVRNSIELTLLNNKTNRRLGCAFIDISQGNLAMVQRYISKLERERNARIAGLG